MKGEMVILIECIKCRHRARIDVTDNTTKPEDICPPFSNIFFTGNGIWGTCEDCSRKEMSHDDSIHIPKEPRIPRRAKGRVPIQLPHKRQLAATKRRAGRVARH